MSNTVVQTNVLALNSHRNLKTVGVQQSRASQKLSSGYRINTAADDAAGLAISEKMRSQIRGLDMASKNSQDAQSLVQTAEGGLQEIDNMVQRIRELVVYAANDTNDQKDTEKSEGDRQKIQDEINQLTSEIDSISGRVEFNKKKVINGESTDYNVRIAEIAGRANEYDSALVDAVARLSSAITQLGSITDASNQTLTASTVSLYHIRQDGTIQVSSTGSLADALSNILTLSANTTDGKIESIDFSSWESNSLTNTIIPALEQVLNGVSAWETSVKESGKLLTSSQAAALDTIKDALRTIASSVKSSIDLKAELDNIKYDINTNNNAQQGLYFQIGANAGQGMFLSINKIKTDTLGIGNGGGQSTIDVRHETGRNITEQLNTLDKALTKVTTERSKLGAAYNRLDYTIKSLDTSSENLSAAESRIRDTDMAKEMMNLTKANVLQSSGISMLSQANSAPQSLLQLLR